MGLFQAAFLGLLQGFTEFLPISSSGHLVIVPILLGWSTDNLVFDTTLHLGTALALIVYFWEDLKLLLFVFLRDFQNRRIFVSKDSMMIFLLGIATIPAGIFGFFANDFLESTFRSIESVAFFMLMGTVLLYFANRKVPKNVDLGFYSAFKIGLFQALALFPGFSRSGATISGGLLVGLSRENAARFSFLLSIPIVLLAGVFQLADSLALISSAMYLPLLIGFLTSFTSGFLCIKFLMSYVKNHGFEVFIYYRLVVVGLLVLLSFMR